MVAALGRRGFDTGDSVRVAFRMPRGWQPTHRKVLTWPRYLPPGVEEVQGVACFPVPPGDAEWALWIAADLDLLPTTHTMPARHRSRWRPSAFLEKDLR